MMIRLQDALKKNGVSGALLQTPLQFIHFLPH